MNELEKKNEKLRQAVADIKAAILQGQYEACKGTNRIQLAVYYAIGKYVSQHSRKGVWGTGALETISSQLRHELPGLRGYSATNLKKMRLFYENWIMLDANSSVATDELESAIAIADSATDNSSVTTDEYEKKQIVCCDWRFGDHRYLSHVDGTCNTGFPCRRLLQSAFHSPR